MKKGKVRNSCRKRILIPPVIYYSYVTRYTKYMYKIVSSDRKFYWTTFSGELLKFKVKDMILNCEILSQKKKEKRKDKKQSAGKLLKSKGPERRQDFILQSYTLYFL